MNKFSAFAVAAAVTLLSGAAAQAADLRVSTSLTPVVRVSLAGKSAAQIDAEIKTAAQTVCTTTKNLVDKDCANSAVADARRQLSSAPKVRSPGIKLEIARNDAQVARVSLKGKTPAQIDADIEAAARTVCSAARNFNNVEYRACVARSVRAAKTQLRTVAEAGKPQAVASL